MTLYEILLFLGWTLTTCGTAFYFGYARKEREIAAEEIVDSLTNPRHPQ